MVYLRFYFVSTISPHWGVLVDHVPDKPELVGSSLTCPFCLLFEKGKMNKRMQVQIIFFYKMGQSMPLFLYYRLSMQLK